MMPKDLEKVEDGVPGESDVFNKTSKGDRATFPGHRKMKRSATVGSARSPKSVPISPKSPGRLKALARSAWPSQMGSGHFTHHVTGQLGFVQRPQRYWSRAEEVGLWNKDEFRALTTAGYTAQERAA
eukprot:3056000-Rhodomonas_salina.1